MRRRVLLALATTAVMASATARRSTCAEPTRPALAAGGYCVVTLRDKLEWERGDPQAAGVFDGREYRFLSLRELGIFAAAPETYAPVLNGDCIVTYANSQERIAGELRSSIVHAGRIYFFAGDANRDAFKADPRRFVDADLALTGNCPVSLRDASRRVPGIPATVARCDGLRYLFASDYQRRLFVASPQRYDGGAATSSSRFTPSQVTEGQAAILSNLAASVAAEKNDASTKSPGEAKAHDVLLGSTPALGGYCAVTIRQEGVWVRGRYDHRVEFADFALLTAGPEQHDVLTGNPAKFIPVLKGDCAVSLVDEQQHVRGSVFHAIEYDDRLFLFADAEHKAAFRDHPEKYALVDVAAGGLCVVTKKDESRDAPGVATESTWYQGWLYRFAGPEQKKKFHARPERYALP